MVSLFVKMFGPAIVVLVGDIGKLQSFVSPGHRTDLESAFNARDEVGWPAIRFVFIAVLFLIIRCLVRRVRQLEDVDMLLRFEDFVQDGDREHGLFRHILALVVQVPSLFRAHRLDTGPAPTLLPSRMWTKDQVEFIVVLSHFSADRLPLRFLLSLLPCTNALSATAGLVLHTAE